MEHVYNIPAGLEESASKYTMREGMRNVYFSAENNEWMAADGRIMTTIKEESEGRPSLCIPLDAVKWSRKTKAPICYVSGEYMSCAGKEFCRAMPINYMGVKSGIMKEPHDVSVTVNAEYLEAALASVKPSIENGAKIKDVGRYSRKVTIRLATKATEYSPVIIENRDGLTSIIMPLRG
jgi:hypothetical protein